MATRNTIAAFLFDKNHLPGFEVFYYSLHKTGSLSNIPKVLITTDETLLDSNLLQNVFTRIIHLTPNRLAQFRDIDATAVKSRHRHKLVAKYTFLKFNVFSEIDAQRILYFDVDMACLQNIDKLIDYSDADLAVARPLPKGKLLNSNGEWKAQPKCEQVVERFWRDSSRYASLPPTVRDTITLNSGVLSIGEKLIGPAVRDGLLARAKSGSYGYEQDVLKDYVRERGDIKVRYLDASYNFPRRALDSTSIEYFSRIKDRIRILHFNGAHPWKRGAKQHYVDFVWWNLYAESRQFITDLSAPRATPSWPVRLRRRLL